MRIRTELICCSFQAGLCGFTKSLAKEVGVRGVRVNMIEAGFIETNMTQGIIEDAERMKSLKQSVTLGRCTLSVSSSGTQDAGDHHGSAKFWFSCLCMCVSECVCLYFIMQGIITEVQRLNTNPPDSHPHTHVIYNAEDHHRNAETQRARDIHGTHQIYSNMLNVMLLLQAYMMSA